MGSSEKRKRTELLGVRCTPEERAHLETAAAALGLKLAAFIRDAALWQAAPFITDHLPAASDNGEKK